MVVEVLVFIYFMLVRIPPAFIMRKKVPRLMRTAMPHYSGLFKYM